MPRTEYQAQLEGLRSDVLAMGELVHERYEQAVETMATGDPDLARRVTEGDHEVNRRYLDLEGECIDLFALQQPVATDLRFVASSFKIVTDLERVGDLATNLAAYGGHTGADRYPGVDLRPIAAFAGEMLADALAAYDGADPAACRAVADRDETLDARCAAAAEAVFTDLLGTDAGTGPRDPDGREDVDAVVDDATRLMLVVRDVERVGDHAVNICARTLYAADRDTALIY